MSTIKILITDDHAVVREGLKHVLTQEFKQVSFGEASSVQEAIDLVVANEWHLVLLDLNLPGRSGLEALRLIKKMRPRLPVLMLSVHPEDQVAVRLIKAGASGYVTKGSSIPVLVQALKKVLGGGHYVSPALAERMASLLGVDVQAPPHEGLSDREFLVLRLIASGKPVSQIALELSLSVKTVSTYRSRLLKKMRMENSAELTHYAIRNELV